MYILKKSTSLATMLLLCAALLLGACSNASNNTQSGSTSSPAPTASPDAAATTEPANTAAATKSYTDSQGSVTIPTEPKRIVDLTGSAIGNLLALDVKPIASTKEGLSNPFHKGMLDGIADLGAGTDAEAILTLEPDLIITYDYLAADGIYEKLTKIAPTISLKYGANSPTELLTEFGKITGREAQAKAWVEKWDAKIAELKPQIVEKVGDKTVSILQPYAKGIYAWGNKGARGGEILYDGFGLKAPAIIQEKLIDGPEFGANLSLESLPEYAGDYIFTSNWGWDDGDPEVVYGSKIWKSLPAVKSGQTYFIDPVGSFFNDPISLEAQLDLIVKSLLGT